MNSTSRFNVIPSGRRSGKTELAKRKWVKRALQANNTTWDDPNFFFAAPTRDQAKRLFWKDLKKLVPKDLMEGAPRESELIIHLINGASLYVVGMDKPERFEGTPWDGGDLDEYANMNEKVWMDHVFPALADRNGGCDFTGVPEGRNHYYDLCEMAKADDTGLWGHFSWPSSDILDPSQIEIARRSMDPLSFQQEFEASFLNFTGRIYYQFDRTAHTSKKIVYDSSLPLVFCFDFNVSPGVAVVAQEFPVLPNGLSGTGIIDEVYIPKSSTTPIVCNKLIQTYHSHQGMVYLYGDATGGNSGTAKLMGSDWDIINRELKPVFKGNLRSNVTTKNPRERARVNAMNTRLKTSDGTIRMMVNPEKARYLVRDLDGVKCIEGGSGEIDKKSDPNLTHLSDALGYYIQAKFPIYQGSGTYDF